MPFWFLLVQCIALGGKIYHHVANYANRHCASSTGSKVRVIAIVNIRKESRRCGDGDRLGTCTELKAEKLFNFYQNGGWTMSLEWVNCDIEQHFDEFPHIWSGFHWNMNWKALFGLAISCVLLLAPARILASSEAAAGGHNNGTERYKLVVFDFERVELPLVICLWILIVALAKIGAYSIKRLYRFYWLAHYQWLFWNETYPRLQILMVFRLIYRQT